MVVYTDVNDGHLENCKAGRREYMSIVLQDMVNILLLVVHGSSRRSLSEERRRHPENPSSVFNLVTNHTQDQFT